MTFSLDESGASPPNSVNVIDDKEKVNEREGSGRAALFAELLGNLSRNILRYCVQPAVRDVDILSMKCARLVLCQSPQIGLLLRSQAKSVIYLLRLVGGIKCTMYKVTIGCIISMEYVELQLIVINASRPPQLPHVPHKSWCLQLCNYA